MPPLGARRLRLVEYIRDGIIGEDIAIDGPFGPRRVIYADYTASGRSLSFIEDWIRAEVLPMYANTHTETSGTGLQTTRFREDARAIIARAVGAGDDDAVIFCGSGATAAINKLVAILGIRPPSQLDDALGIRASIPERARPVVFIGPYEHHSNELPWRESIADVVTIDEDANGQPDIALLEDALVAFADRPLKIGSFSAASNVTGIGSQTSRISALLHRHGALAFWDFAAAGPYVKIEMNLEGEGADAGLAYKDAIFLSPHKFIGGPGTPGVLVVKRRLVTNRVPTAPGGGTVAYVSHADHRYLEDVIHREEAGTPAIIESVRAGLVFQLKAAVGEDVIGALEHAFVRRAVERWSGHENIQILGNRDAWRLSIVSFVVRYDAARYLHHNFVVAILNDLFGIQARGGCSCAGPYGHRLLGIDLTRSREFEREILRGCEGVKPGWVRVNFNYFISEPVFAYILDAVEWVGAHAWRLLPLYDFDPDAGTWRHKARRDARVGSLGDITYEAGHLEYPSRRMTEPESALRRYLLEAAAILTRLEVAGSPEAETTPFESLRWFPLPAEATERALREPVA